MKLYSTNKKSPVVNLKEAIFKGLPNDNGLYLPVEIPLIPGDILKKSHELSFQEISFHMAQTLLSDEVTSDSLMEIVNGSFDFEVPLTQLDQNIHVLELFHGPTLAFKDFGARFMARLMSHFLEGQNREINILVATSGDTGSAVAKGFLGVPGIKVTLLYPSSKVSVLQEKQLTTNGYNISALEVLGTFDDCQKMVKDAFLDPELNGRLNLTSANSINIARLIPQSFYYLYAWSRLKAMTNRVAFCVPSGNFGNLCGGLLARKMGMKVDQFVAATNVNKIVPEYLESGVFAAKPSVQTLSNAMDVGNPSNFPRLTALLGNDHSEIRKRLTGYYFTDDETIDTISEVYDRFDYFLCPHSAIGYRGAKSFLSENPDYAGICLATAHPAKFLETVDKATGSDAPLPARLEEVLNKPKEATQISNRYEDLKNFLLS